MMTEFRSLRSISERADQMARWIGESSAECIGEQKHLIVGSQERAYWQYGYMVALRDVLRFLADKESAGREAEKADKRSLRRAA